MGVLSRFRRRAGQPAVDESVEEPTSNTSSRRVHANNMETWVDRDAKVEVTQPEGFLMKVALHAKVDLPPDQVYAVLTAPDNAAIFKGIKKVKYRKVLEDDGKGKQKVEVEQVAAWKLLMFHGSFSTRLFVNQDQRQGTVKFSLAKPGLMRDFAGEWRVQPFTLATQGRQPGGQPAKGGAPWSGLVSSVHGSLFGRQQEQASLLSLEQSLEPAVRPPKPLEGLVKSIAVAQLRGILDDLRLEVPRIKAGCPSIQGWRDSSGQRPEEEEECSRGSSPMKTQAAPVAALNSITWPGLAAGVAPLSGDVGAASEDDEPLESRRGDSWWPGQGWWSRLSGHKRQQKQALWAVADWHDSSAADWAGRRSGADASHDVQRRC